MTFFHERDSRDLLIQRVMPSEATAFLANMALCAPMQFRQGLGSPEGR